MGCNEKGNDDNMMVGIKMALLKYDSDDEKLS